MAENILITGATSAIGSALAREYAAPGVTLYLHGRNAERLNEVAATCQARGAQVSTTLLDVRDFIALRAWLEGQSFALGVEAEVAALLQEVGV